MLAGRRSERPGSRRSVGRSEDGSCPRRGRRGHRPKGRRVGRRTARGPGDELRPRSRTSRRRAGRAGQARGAILPRGPRPAHLTFGQPCRDPQHLGGSVTSGSTGRIRPHRAGRVARYWRLHARKDGHDHEDPAGGLRAPGPAGGRAAAR
ncbi:hypothetical protein Y09_1816 [Brachybacterium sp. SW0106-09]|nr:hypothetical protein Y09_1816 [Brachybacterium sp. SW0106-09]